MEDATGAVARTSLWGASALLHIPLAPAEAPSFRRKESAVQQSWDVRPLRRA
jgi:hypothetical protein